MNPGLNDLVRAKLLDFSPQRLEPFLARLKELVGDRCLALLAYGSCLSDATRTQTSTPDFFVVVDSYGSFHRRRLHRILNRVLPPNIYHFAISGRTAKYNVLSLRHLIRETSRHARDCYILGRASKRLALLWTRDERVSDRIVAAQASALRTIDSKVVHLMPGTFGLEEFTKEALRFSYTADVRVEAEDKIQRLFEAEREFYLAVHGSILEEMQGPPFLLTKGADGRYTKPPRGLWDFVGRARTRWFLAVSRMKAQIRWPKGIFTVEGWVDYLLAKIERTQGIKIEMTDRQKKFWFIYGWKYFLMLRRKKLIK
ncbi:MAG: hypothetical protein V1798_09035 [Pseudomonadota bacterium]